MHWQFGSFCGKLNNAYNSAKSVILKMLINSLKRKSSIQIYDTLTRFVIKRRVSWTTKDTLSIEIAQWARILYYFRSSKKNDRLSEIRVSSVEENHKRVVESFFKCENVFAYSVWNQSIFDPKKWSHLSVLKWHDTPGRNQCYNNDTNTADISWC